MICSYDRIGRSEHNKNNKEKRNEIMLENMLFSINVIIPLFAIGILGYVLVKMKLVDSKFMSTVNMLTFKVFLPIKIFGEIYYAERTDSFDLKFFSYCLGMNLLIAIIAYFGTKLAVKDRFKQGAIVQGIFRSNFVLLGLAIVDNMFGATGVMQVTMVMPFVIALYNILGVVVLVNMAPDKQNQNKIDILDILKNIIKNPLIISTIIGFLFLLFNIKLPEFIGYTIDDLSSIATPLALLSIGGLFNFSSSWKNLKYSVITTILRLVIIPLVGVVIAILLGFRNEQLAVILILLGTPTAVASTAMTKSMGGDFQLNADIVMMTTLFSGFTIFGFIYMLRMMQLI